MRKNKQEYLKSKLQFCIELLEDIIDDLETKDIPIAEITRVRLLIGKK